MKTADFLDKDGRAVIVAIDHAMYSWPCNGLEDRGAVLRQVSEAGADAIIASYGTIRDFRDDFGKAKPILKLDNTVVTLGSSYAVTEYLMSWTLEDAQRLGVGTVLTYIQLGAPFELEALRVAGRLAADCDKAGLTYLCEIMPIESERFPDAAAPDAIAASCRTGQEIGAHAIKTTMPNPPSSLPDSAACGIPVILAGGAVAGDRAQLFKDVQTAMDGGAAGVAFGRNVWASNDPAGTVRKLVEVVHGKARN
jgi:class I fructose-bisphosphate aldolase/fructose-bisphosphate aldolase/2-amino-3,7-dideoxy-D-threo-hept-6-ulosonate synthase